MFKSDDIAILNTFAQRGLPMRIGQRVTIIDQIDSFNYDYQVEFDDSEKAVVRECELNELSEKDKQFMSYIFTNNKVKYHDEEVTIVKCDYLHKKVEILIGEVENVVDFKDLQPIHNVSLEDDNKLGYFGELGLSIGKLVDQKQRAYGDSVTKCYEIMKVLLKDYKKADGTYIIPESLLPQMLLDIRKIDKLNRRFSNPDGDLMEENSFQDDVGYSLLGVRLIEQLKKDGLYD